MLIQPGAALSPAIRKRGLKSRLLLHWRARDLSLVPVTGQTPTFSRASAGALRDSAGRYYAAVHSQPRFEHVDTNGDGLGDEAGLVLETTRTNSALWSSDFSNAVWTNGAGYAVATAASIIAGQVAQRNTNPGGGGSLSRTQTAGVLSAAGDTVWAIVENVSAVETCLGLFDVNLGAFVHRIVFNWSTRIGTTGTGSGSLFVKKIAEVGPNGGPVYLLGVSGVGTAGNVRRMYIYPSGTPINTNVAVLHHAQIEGGSVYPSSPIVTGAASAARTTDRLTHPCNIAQLAPDADDFTLYARLPRPNFADASGSIIDFPGILSLGCVVPYVQLYFLAGSRFIGAEVNDGAAHIATANAAIPAGQIIEVAVQVRDLAVAPGIAIDVGAGLSAFVTNSLVPITAFGNKIGLGEINDGALKLGGPIFETKIARGLLSMDQMREAF